MDINSMDQALDELQRVQRELQRVDRELEALRGPPCARCGHKSADRTTLVGGYETILCLACRNAWSVAADESGAWLEYRKASALERAARDAIKAGIKSGATVTISVTDHVEATVAAERKLFQFAMTWVEKK